MDLQLTGKKAIVTGASRGIGRAIARQFPLEGCDVAICTRTEGRLKRAAAELAKESGRKVVPIVCDTLNADAINHIVINNAARLGGTPGTVETVKRRRCPARLRREGGRLPPNGAGRRRHSPRVQP